MPVGVQRAPKPARRSYSDVDSSLPQQTIASIEADKTSLFTARRGLVDKKTSNNF